MKKKHIKESDWVSKQALVDKDMPADHSIHQLATLH